MFFLIPGGGFFSFIILLLVIRLVFRSLFGSKNSNTHYYYYDSRTNQQQYQNQNNSNSNANRAQYQPTKDYYSVLGLTSAASDDEIKKAYRKLIMEYHPDKVANNTNNDDKFKEFAAKRFREVQDAYEQICKLRGIK